MWFGWLVVLVFILEEEKSCCALEFSRGLGTWIYLEGFWRNMCRAGFMGLRLSYC